MVADKYRDIIRKTFRVILIAGVLLSFSACSEKLVLEPEMQRSVLIYIAGDNDLSSSFLANINTLKRGGFLPFNGNIIIYLDVPNANPRFFRLVRNRTTNAIEEELIEHYTKEDGRATDPAVLTRTLNRTRELFPAKEYGLILLSHASGWVPHGMLSSLYLRQSSLFAAPSYARLEDLPTTRAFGGYRSDRGMEIDELVAAIPYRLSFILFDTCVMGSIEVAYALRNVADYLIASPTEILSSGFPYDKIMQPMFLPRPDLKAVCNDFYNFYNEAPDGPWRSASIALYHTEPLEELAHVLRPIFSAHRTALNHFSTDNVQHYANAPIFYDLDHFILQLATPSEYALFKASLDKVVLHKRNTDYFFTLILSIASIPITHFGGISTYIPINAQSAIRAAYTETEWNRAVGMLE